MSGKSLENGEERVSDSSSIDRLSALPDEILIRILSFLGGQTSAVTSMLSKRWKLIWVELPRLEFYDRGNESDETLNFVAKVNRTLLIRRSTHLEKLHVCFWYDCSFASDVDSLLEFAVKNKANEVNLILRTIEELELYGLPEMMYSNPSLTRFSVWGCLVDTLTKIEWQSLTRLKIMGSELPQHMIENILSGCPVLHTLGLGECWGFNCLDVKSQNLYELGVYGHKGGENGHLLEISAPYLHTLDVSFNPKAIELVLMNIESLVSAGINFTGSFWNSEEIVTSTTEELFEIFKDVKELNLGSRYFKVLSELVTNGWQLPVSRRKCLTVNVFEDKHIISGIFALLKFSPNLERLAIDDFGLCGETWDEASAMGDLDSDLMHLKTVIIRNIANPAFCGEPMLTVARTLLKRAMVLEEMTIKLGLLLETNDYAKIGQTLLVYPRSSRKAVIRLY